MKPYAGMASLGGGEADGPGPGAGTCEGGGGDGVTGVCPVLPKTGNCGPVEAEDRPSDGADVSSRDGPGGDTESAGMINRGGGSVGSAGAGSGRRTVGGCTGGCCCDGPGWLGGVYGEG